MRVSSLAAQAIAAGPATLAPPSFNGQGWLFVINLFAFTAGFALCLMLAGKLAIDKWRCGRAPNGSPDHDGWRSPIMLWRRIGLLMALGFTIRCGAEAQSLWQWNALDPAASGAAMTLKRILDPVAALIGFTGLGMFYLSLPGLTEQLRKEPFPISMWTSLPLLKRPGGVVLCCLGAAVAVVAFR